MKVQILGSNQTEVIFSKGHSVFFSYETPVVLTIGGEVFRTTEKFSKTTSKHINHYIGCQESYEISQEEIEKALGSIRFNKVADVPNG